MAQAWSLQPEEAAPPHSGEPFLIAAKGCVPARGPEAAN